MKQAELSVRHALRYYEWTWQHAKEFTTLQFSSSTIVAPQIQHSMTLQLEIGASWLGFCNCAHRPLAGMMLCDDLWITMEM